MYNFQHKYFQFKFLNPYYSDPVVWYQIKSHGEALLFDLGDLHNASTKDLLAVKKVFVSHTHMDHFFGFDRLMRSTHSHYPRIDFFGPPRLAEQIFSKIKGYTWNLLEDKQVQFRVVEIDFEGNLQCFRIENNPDFQMEIQPALLRDLLPKDGSVGLPTLQKPAVSLCLLEDGSRVDAIALDHGIPSISYSVQSRWIHKVNTEKLNERGLDPGVWIKEVQKAMNENRAMQTVPKTVAESWGSANKPVLYGEIAAEMMSSHTSRWFGYITDCDLSPLNLNRIKQLHDGTQKLVCEASFRASDIEKAKKKKHLTTQQLALIVCLTKSNEYHPFHFSQVYASGDPIEQIKEVQSFIDKYAGMSDEELERLAESL